MSNSIYNWQIYTMNNDGQKEVLQKGLSYKAAIEAWQHNNTLRMTGKGGYERMSYESVEPRNFIKIGK